MSRQAAIFSFLGAVLFGCGGAVPALPTADAPADASRGGDADDTLVLGRPSPDVSRGQGPGPVDASISDATAGDAASPVGDGSLEPSLADDGEDAARAGEGRGADAEAEARDADRGADARVPDALPADAGGPGPGDAAVGVALTCRSGDPSCGPDHECDTASDCDDDNVCCYDFSSMPAATRCRNDCNGGGGTRLQACRTQGECTSGTCSVHACAGQPAIQSCQPRAPECP